MKMPGVPKSSGPPSSPSEFYVRLQHQNLPVLWAYGGASRAPSFRGLQGSIQGQGLVRFWVEGFKLSIV